jgi:hypothetical protein
MKALLLCLLPALAFGQAGKGGTSTTGPAGSVTASPGTSAVITGNVADGASAKAVTLNSNATLANASARVVSIQNGGTETLGVLKDSMHAPGTFKIYSDVANGSSAVGVLFGTTNSMTGSAKVFSVYNGASEKIFLDGNGNLQTSAYLYFTGGAEMAGDTFRAYGNNIRILGMAQSGNANAQVLIGPYFYDQAATDKIVGVYRTHSNYGGGSGMTGNPYMLIYGSGVIAWPQASDASGTPGAATINEAKGLVSIAAGNSSVVVTDSEVTATSHVSVEVQTNDATCAKKNVVPASGSFTVTMTATCTATTKLSFIVFR